MEVSELADEGEQGPKYYAKAPNLNVQHCAATTEKLRWLICLRSCSILAWCTAKVKHGYGESLAKVDFLFSEDVLFRVKEFRTTVGYVISSLHSLSDVSMFQWQPQERLATGRGQRSQSSDQNILRGITVVLKFDSASWNHGVKSIYYSFFFCLPFLDTEYDIVYCPRQRRAPHTVDGKWFETPSCLASTQMWDVGATRTNCHTKRSAPDAELVSFTAQLAISLISEPGKASDFGLAFDKKGTIRGAFTQHHSCW